MPRANRYIVPGQIYHLTHRCHNQAFLLRFGIDRESYRKWLREGLERHGVGLEYGAGRRSATSAGVGVGYTINKSLQKVFSCAGHALLSAQFMEKELAFLLLLPQMRKREKVSSESEIQEVKAKLDRMTFGRLINQLKNIVGTDGFSTKLQDALGKRNHLAHWLITILTNIETN
jgi:hypothetical protein